MRGCGRSKWATQILPAWHGPATILSLIRIGIEMFKLKLKQIGLGRFATWIWEDMWGFMWRLMKWYCMAIGIVWYCLVLCGIAPHQPGHASPEYWTLVQMIMTTFSSRHWHCRWWWWCIGLLYDGDDDDDALTYMHFVIVSLNCWTSFNL